jgi:Ser/Thr protein kinase RdoA (MazF antagonist)
MEAEVYGYGPDAVLKLYTLTTSLAALQELQTFYTSLDRSHLSYALPSIQYVAGEGSYHVTIEPRLAGQPLATLLDVTPPHQFDTLFIRYVDAVLELATIAMPPTTATYKLFDPTRLSVRAAGDWHVFLRRWLDQQLHALAPHFEQDVVNFHAKRAQITALLTQPYRGAYHLIHGDIFPGNLLVAPDGQPQALLDFGLFTMYGDPLFDAATAWVFFDMYDERHANVRARLLPYFFKRLGAGVVGRLYRYVLLYSLLSANTYAADCRDGHYAWCVANLNTATYWQGMA